MTKPHLSVKLYIDQSNIFKTNYDKQMHVANCEYLLPTISCEMNADEYLFLVDLNERRVDNTNLVWLTVTFLEAIITTYLMTLVIYSLYKWNARPHHGNITVQKYPLSCT